MEDNKNLPAFPDTMRAAPQSYLNQNPEDWPTGLTKREYITTAIDVSSDMENMSTGLKEKLVGRGMPDESIEYYHWLAAVEAKMRIIKADAVLTELSKS